MTEIRIEHYRMCEMLFHPLAKLVVLLEASFREHIEESEAEKLGEELAETLIKAHYALDTYKRTPPGSDP